MQLGCICLNGNGRFGDATGPSREEVQEWGISFEKLLTSKTGVKIFHDFLKSQYSEENLLFWLAVEKLKKETDQATFKELAQSIYRDYLSAESPKEVSIDHKTRQHIEEVLEEPDQTVYDNAQRHVYYVMYQDCYPRFIVSNVFKALLISNDWSCDPSQWLTFFRLDSTENDTKLD